jgi:hypothetical protein
MISRDECMCLVVKQGDVVKTVINLGYATLDGVEYDKLRTLAEAHGCYISIDPMDLEEVKDFATLYSEVQKAIL